MSSRISQRARRRAALAVSLEWLEPRTLLNGTPAASPNPQETLLVRFQSSVSTSAEQAFLSAIGGQVEQTFPDGPSVIVLAAGADRASAIAQLQASHEVVYAEPDQTLQATGFVPNDGSFSQQWGLNTADNIDIDAPEAWTLSTGSPSTIIAVLDSGLDISRPDFAGRLWTDPATGIHGWNFIAGNGNFLDDNGHGTHVTGVLAATGNNGTGIAGVNWHAQIMPLKMIDAQGNGSIDAAITAIYFAVQHGARVINASWDSPQVSQALADAIAFAGTQGAVVVAAAGNESANNDTVATYPADDRLPNLISVAAVDQFGNLGSFSNYGAHTVDLAAPGVDILSTVPGGFDTMSGTSMAAPFVAGVVSLVIGQNPSLTATQVISQVLSTVKPLPSLVGRTVTGGMVDAFAAIALLRPQVSLSTGIPQSDLALYRPSSGLWLVDDPATGKSQLVQFGQPGVDMAVPADYDGVGHQEFAVYRPTTAQWFIQGPGGGRVVQFGAPGLDIPVPADYDGDGHVDVAVFRPSTATWYILGSSAGPFSRQFGAPRSDIPVPGDYNGDGKAELAVFRPSTAQWFFEKIATGATSSVQFGSPGTIPVPADYDGDGRTDPAVLIPSTATWAIDRSSQGTLIQQFGTGNQTVPIPHDYDGDGKADLAGFNSSDATWFILRSSAGLQLAQFGQPGLDVPVNAPLMTRLAGTILSINGGIAAHALAASSTGGSVHIASTSAGAGSPPLIVPLETHDKAGTHRHENSRVHRAFHSALNDHALALILEALSGSARGPRWPGERA